MKNNKMTEEELKKIKAELKKELMEEMKLEKKIVNKNVNVNNNQQTKSNDDLNEKVDFKIPFKTSKLDKFETALKESKANETIKESTTSVWLIPVIILIVVAGLFLLPKAYKYFSSKVPQEKISEKKKEEIEEKKIEYKWDDKIIKELTYPIMRNDIYSSDSYYKNESITMSNFNNNDILYNAFVNMYAGNISDYLEGYNEIYCGNDSTHKEFNAKYIDARVKNLYTESTEYVHSDFYVPSNNKSTSYVGKWVYDAINNRYIYYGLCGSNNVADTMYYDILVKDSIVTNDTSDTVYLTYYIGFAIVKNNTYEIYSDPEYTNLITSGTVGEKVTSELEKIIKSDASKYKKYKYTFSTLDCAYQDFCYVSGEWNK